MRRGQALVLFALLMLLVALMALMTLSLGLRVRERTELQTTADAAAYSQAVLTARTFNQLATLNRAQLALMVSALGVQSLISWSSYYLATLDMLRRAARDLREPGSVCAPGGDPRLCACRQSEQQLDHVEAVASAEELRLRFGWPGADQSAGSQLRDIVTSASSLWSEEYRLLRELERDLDGSDGRRPLAGRIAAAAGVEAVGPLALNARERERLIDPESLENPGHQDTGDAVRAAMGTRGDGFVTRRERATERIEQRLYSLLGLGYVLSFTHAGSSYPGPYQRPSHGTVPYPAAVVGEDHGTLTLTLQLREAPCRSSATVEGEAFVASTETVNRDDVHRWSGGEDPNPVFRHTTGDCTACSGAWPHFINLDPGALASADDVWGQPKTVAFLRRDVSAQPLREPWALRVGLWGGALDLRGRAAQLAASTGLVYYHRGGSSRGVRHFREPPTFFNPFWRATLVAPDVDEAVGHRGDDVVAMLDTLGENRSARTLRLLRAQGYRGLQ